LAFSPDGKFLASGGGPPEGSIDNLELWEMPAGKSRRFLKGHTNYVYSLAFSADSSILASGSGDSTVRLWDPQSGTLKQTLKVDEFTPGFALSPQGQQLVTKDPTLGPTLFDIPSGAPKALRVDFAASFALSPDGKTLAVGSYWEEQPAEIELIDVASGTVRRRLKGPHGSVRSLAFSPDGKLLASGGLRLGAANPNDPSSKPPGGTVYLWRLE
jgi:WD40 repeat protein